MNNEFIPELTQGNYHKRYSVHKKGGKRLKLKTVWNNKIFQSFKQQFDKCNLEIKKSEHKPELIKKNNI